jgi:hypothetical protein
MMFLPEAKPTFLFLLLILFFSTTASSQVLNDSTNFSKDTTSEETKTGIIEDTLSGKIDTISNLQDTSARVKDTVTAAKDTLDIITSTDGLNTIPGFRVQIGSTQDLSEAMNERARAETLLVNYNIYIIYDSPYYKVRAGDFRARYDATQAANLISGRGFSEAWVVPDNVFKNPIDRRKGNR